MNRYPTTATISSETEKRTTMKNVGFTAITATALTAGLLGLATPALAAPTGGGDAQDTISSLQDQGYRVIVNSESATPLADASVVSVREAQSFLRTTRGVDNDGDDNEFGTTTATTVYVTVK